MTFFKEMSLRIDILILGLSVLGLGDIWTIEKTQINGQNVARRISIDILHLYHNPGQFALVKYYTQFFRFIICFSYEILNVIDRLSFSIFLETAPKPIPTSTEVILSSQKTSTTATSIVYTTSKEESTKPSKATTQTSTKGKPSKATTETSTKGNIICHKA